MLIKELTRSLPPYKAFSPPAQRDGVPPVASLCGTAHGVGCGGSGTLCSILPRGSVFSSLPQGFKAAWPRQGAGGKQTKKKKEKEAALKIAPLATVPGNGLGHMGKRLRAGSGGEGSGASSCPPCCCLNRGWLGCGAALPCQLHPRLTELLA